MKLFTDSSNVCGLQAWSQCVGHSDSVINMSRRRLTCDTTAAAIVNSSRKSGVVLQSSLRPDD